MNEDKETPENKDDIMGQAKKLLEQRNSFESFINMGFMVGSLVLGMKKAGCSDDEVKLILPFINPAFSKGQQDKKE